MFSHFFIDRPIFACVVCLIITLLGAITIPNLPIEQFPDITPPTISISANYPGASAEDVANAVAIPLEQQINGVDNMIYMETSCTSDGMMQITVSFEVGTDPDIASVLVQNRVKIAEPLLPEEVRRLGVKVDKRSTSFVCFMSLFEKQNGQTGPKNPEINPHGGGISGALAQAEAHAKAANAGTKSGPYLCNYAGLYLKDRLARVKGVGDVMMFDNRDFSMRIWLDEDAMAARGISVQEVLATVKEQNVQVAAGRIGLSPIPEGTQTNLAIVTLGRLEDVSQFENMILRVDENGGVLRIKDIAVVELGAASYTLECRYNGQMSTGIGVSQRSGANALDVSKRTLALMEEQRPTINRSGLDYAVTFNATDFISATVHEFIETLVLCVVFVVGTVYIFLQDWRAALIPTLTIPVSIIGTFFLMYLFGFSINTMTLFGLILVIGIVVDDAIVVVENTQRIIDEEHIDAHSAAKQSMIEVMGPVVATVLVMMAVFVPTAMMQGIVGKLYQQFALTIAGAIAISGICAVTLAPALCAILLRPSVPKEKRFFGFRLFNFFFDGFTNFYSGNVKAFIRVAPLVLLLWIALVGVLLYVVKVLPSGFLPNEDQGVIFLDVELPEGATQERTAEVLRRIEDYVFVQRGQEVVDKGITSYEPIKDEKGNIVAGGVRGAMFVNGYSFMGGQASNRAMSIIALQPWKKRKDKALKPLGDTGIISRLAVDFQREIPEANITMFTPPPIMGLGMATGVSYQLLDERDTGPANLYAVLQDVRAKAVDYNPIVFALAPFNPNSPRLHLDIDRDKAKRMGLSLNEVFTALQSNLGTAYVNDFNKFGRTFRVNVQAKGEYRDNVEDVLTMKVKNAKGTMVPLGSFVSIKEVAGPQSLTRYNLYPSAKLTAILAPNRSTSEGIVKLEQVNQTLPDGFSGAWTDMTFQEVQVGNQTAFIFALSILFAFLILSAQYESWSAPLIIMMAVPLGVAGSVLAVFLFGKYGGSLMEMNMYTQIGLLMMVGLSAKNAILITEFAKEKREHGLPLTQAAYEAGRLRLRPIFMTSFAFILGVVPLVIADGAGSNSRNAIGNCVFGGLFMETLVGVYVTPILFVLIAGWAEYFMSHIKSSLAKSHEKALQRSGKLDEVVIRHGD